MSRDFGLDLLESVSTNAQCPRGQLAAYVTRPYSRLYWDHNEHTLYNNMYLFPYQVATWLQYHIIIVESRRVT